MDNVEIQQRLRERGLYHGPIDGVLGNSSKAAIITFQKMVGLYPDGIAGPKTQLALKAYPERGDISVPAPPRQTMSQIGLTALVSREDLRTKAYQDTKGIWTIGVGHTAAAGAPVPYKGLVISREEGMLIFARDLQQYEDAVREAIKVPLTDHQFDSLGSICFNIGQGGFKTSTFVKKINAGASTEEIKKAIMQWQKPPEIKSRRQAEADQFATPYSVRLPKGRSTDAAPIKP